MARPVALPRRASNSCARKAKPLSRACAEDIEAQLIAKVREKPVTSLAIAAGVGFLFALLSRR